MPHTPTFYTAGGTLPPDSPSYIERPADRALYEQVRAGEFCYVLTPRQMGKSSLMARTARQLRGAGVHTAIVDLSQIGAEQGRLEAGKWYYGIARRIARELKIAGELKAWWGEREDLPALQRLSEFYGDYLLARTEGPVAVFVDEIDTTIALPFTDDFFAAIRACFNARASEAPFRRLSFVLLGVASPSDLMKDTRRTPFNIGRKIDLSDFTLEEARPLTAGLGNGAEAEALLGRIFHWTGGHPYLTQKLCRAVAEAPDGESPEDRVDRTVQALFLAPEASREEYNLNFVRDRLTRGRSAARRNLLLYRALYRGKQVGYDPLAPAHNALTLSGLVIAGPERRLEVRNRLYRTVFDERWAKENTPANRNLQLGMIAAALLIIAGVLIWRSYQASLEAQAYADARTAVTTVLGESGYYDSQLFPEGNYRALFLTSSDSFVLISTAYRDILPPDRQYVLDLNGGIYWQRSGSPDKRDYTAASNYIAELNQRKHGTYSDWRLPTLEEAMRLLQKDTTANGLHQDRLFDTAREQMWTSDSATAYRAWRIDFRRGRIDGAPFDSTYHVRAVRTVESAKAYVTGMDSLVTTMIRKKGYYDRFRNPGGEGITRTNYPYERQAGGLVIYDPKTNLSWQQSGSRYYRYFESARAYIDSLNYSSFAGFDDWRLPTLEEAMSLVEPERKGNGLFIDPKFDSKQRWIWTSSQWRASAAWLVNFNGGYCSGLGIDLCVRAVRVGQSSR